MPVTFIAKNEKGTLLLLKDTERGEHWIPRKAVPYLSDNAVEALPIKPVYIGTPPEQTKISRPLYLVGSLRNEEIAHLANFLEENTNFDIFDDWFAAGPIADDSWREYEMVRRRSYREALAGYAARHVFGFDYHHLNRCVGGILYLPAGKSAHLEAGYLCGQGKPVFVLMPENEMPERWDVMYQFCRSVSHTKEELAEEINKYGKDVGGR